MAKVVGIDVGEFEVKAVELEGSYRRPRLTRLSIEAVAAGGGGSSDEDHAARVAEATLLALDAGGFAKDNAMVTFPCREAVLRILDVPFIGEDKIRKVIKFEAEGSIHSHNVDDMVVDFHVLGPGDASTRVLVAAVPKASLRPLLVHLEGLGIEPVVVDLDTMALFRTAQWCGAFDVSIPAEGEPGAGDAPLVAEPPVRVVLDVGARSTRIVVVANGEIVDMRALRSGFDSVGEEVAANLGISLVEAREAVQGALRERSDYTFAAGEGEEGEAPEDLPVVAYGDVLAAVDRYLTRLRRELVRFLTSIPSHRLVEQVWITGGPSTVPQVCDLVQDVFGVRPQPLDVMSSLSHKFDEAEAAEIGPRIAVALGLALQSLSGKRSLNFRQEELAYTKGFDRIKFPLALTCMLALFLVLVHAVSLRNRLVRLEHDYGATHSDVEEEGRRGTTARKIQFYGYVGALANPVGGSWFAEKYDKPDYQKLMAQVAELPVFQRLGKLRSDLVSHFTKLQQESGYYPDLRLGSGLGALSETATILDRLESQLGRYLVTKLEVHLPSRDVQRKLYFQVALRSDGTTSFREKGAALRAAFEEACKSPQSAFASVDDSSGEKEVFNDGAGEGYYVDMHLVLKPEGQYPIFPPEQS